MAPPTPLKGGGRVELWEERRHMLEHNVPGPGRKWTENRETMKGLPA